MAAAVDLEEDLAHAALSSVDQTSEWVEVEMEGWKLCNGFMWSFLVKSMVREVKELLVIDRCSDFFMKALARGL